MNKEYEVVWNPSSEEWNGASELTEKNQGPKKRKIIVPTEALFKNHFLAVPVYRVPASRNRCYAPEHAPFSKHQTLSTAACS